MTAKTLAQALSETSQSPESLRGLCKSLSILGHPVVFDMYYNCSAATLIAEILIWSIFSCTAEPRCEVKISTDS